jgi:cell division transport system permease protein
MLMKDAIGRGLRNLSNFRYLHGICVITIALSIFVVSAFALFLTNAASMMEAWSKEIRMTAYLKPDTSEAARDRLILEIRSWDGVSAVDYISSHEAFEWLKVEIGRQSVLLEGLTGNPLPDTLEISLSDEFSGADAVSAIAARINGFSEISDVEYARQWLDRFSGLYGLFRLTGIILIVLIFAAMMMVVANTIRLILYLRIEEIKVMRIIGADDSFIKYPLYFEGLSLGLAGGMAGLLLLYTAYQVTVPQLSASGLLIYFQVGFLPWPIVLVLLTSSMTIGLAGCFLSVRRFLKY